MIAHITNWSFLFVFLYAFLLVLVIRKSSFFQFINLSRRALITLFLIKLLFGITYGLVNYYLINGRDSFVYFMNGQHIYYTVFTNPAHYLELTFGFNGREIPSHLTYILKDMAFDWYNTGSYMVVRFNSLLRIISFGNYFVHVVFICFLSFCGTTALFRLFSEASPKRSKLFIVSIYLIPSVLFWSSGIHKDGLILFAIGTLLLNFHNLIYHGFLIRRLLYFLLSGLLIFLVRDYLWVILFPNLVAYYWTFKSPKAAFGKFLITNCLFWAVFLNITLIFPVLKLTDHFTLMQTKLSEFIGNSDIALPLVEPTMFNILINCPTALVNCLLRPHPFETDTSLQILSFFETYSISLVLIIFISSHIIKRTKITPLSAISLFFALAYLILIGMVVPNLGTISRYKSTPLLFLITFSILIADTGLLKNMHLISKND